METIERRRLLAGCCRLAAAGASVLFGCAAADANGAHAIPETGADGESAGTLLPPASPDDSLFGIDVNINMATIDEYLHRDDVAYTDMRMIHDPADYAAIGGDSDPTVTLEGFKIVPFPFVGTLQELPVEGAYEGPTLFEIAWSEEGAIESASANYEESLEILKDLFPRDKANFVMCGGAGYARMMIELLKYLGWSADAVHNIGGAWDYAGYHPQELVRVDKDGKTHYYTWRVDIPSFDFSLLNPIGQ